MRYLTIFILLSLASCAAPDPERYEIRSPCVAAEGIENAPQHPCARRRPAGNAVIYG